LQFIEIKDAEEQSINDCVAMVSELKLLLQIQNWILTIALAKNWCATNSPAAKIFNIDSKHQSKSLKFHKLKEIKSKLLNSEFTTENFITNVPYVYADAIKIQLEFIASPTYFNWSYIANAIKLLENSLVDTCRVCPQDIYMKVATILKVPNESKYKTGEFGIKQLTSRVITLDHDVLHRELIPHFGEYAVSEKTDGITSIVLIIGKEIFITCGSIVYKFEVAKFPALPSAKNIELLKLNRMDFNNTWIFDAEIIVNSDGLITLTPFDIRMASSINVDNINFKYRLMFINGLADLKVNKVAIKIKKWYKSSDIKTLYEMRNRSSKIDGFIFAYLESINFTVSMYYSSRIWKWKPPMLIDEVGTNERKLADDTIIDNNTIDFLIQKCPDSLKGKFPYMSSGKMLYVLCCGINKATHQTLPNITVIPSLVPTSANEYIPALFSPSDKPFSHLYWSTNPNLHSEIGEFAWTGKEWKLLRIRHDRKVEVLKGNYFGNDHKTAENNWFMMNNKLTIGDLSDAHQYNNAMMTKHKFLNAIYENLVKHIFISTETLLVISSITILECFNRFVSVVYAYKNKVEANRYIKDKYELVRNRVRLNSYYVIVDRIKEIMPTIESSHIPISSNGFDHLLLFYTINNEMSGFCGIDASIETLHTYTSLISKNGKITIVMQDIDNGGATVKKIEDILLLMNFTKQIDAPVCKWVYITDNELYDSTRILMFERTAGKRSNK
jgi:hypothetical protein